MSPLVRIFVIAHGTTQFRATLDGEHIVTSDRPLVDAARILLGRGYDPATPLTMRHIGSLYDSFVLMPIGEWAKLTYEEGAKAPLNRRKWKPFPDGVSRRDGRPKVALGAPEGGNTHADGESSVAAPPAAGNVH